MGAEMSDMTTSVDETIIAEYVRIEALQAQIRDLQVELENSKSNVEQLRNRAWGELGIGPDDDTACYEYEKHLMRMGRYMRGTAYPWTTGARSRGQGK